MDILTDIPNMDGLSSPHLLVAGHAWRHDAVRAILSRLVLAGQSVVYVGGAGIAQVDRPSAVELRLLDLTDALGASTESAIRLKQVVLALGGAEAQRVAMTIDTVAAESGSRTRTPVPVRGVSMVPIMLPDDPARAAAVIDDIEHHARDESLPPPVVLVGNRPTAPSVVRDDLVAGDIRVDQVRASMAVRSGVDGDQDWMPYASLGVEPRLLAEDIAGSIEVVVANLRASPDYAKANDEVLRDIARDHVHNERWTIAREIAAGAVRTQSATGWSMRALLDAAADRGARPGVDHVRTMLGGAQRMPAWWTQPCTIVTTGGSTLATRYELLLDSLLDHGSAPGMRERRKAIVIDDDQLLATEVGRESLLRVARTGRKYALMVVVAADQPDDLGQALGLMNNWLIHRSTGSSASDQEHQQALAEQGIEGYLRIGPDPVPIGRWYSVSDVADGHRLLTGTATVTDELEETA